MPVTVKLPAVTPVMVIVQVPPVKVQLASTVPIAVLDDENVTLPVGVFDGLVMSVTVTEHEPVRPAVTDAAHDTTVEVSSLTTVIALDVPELPL